MPNCFDIGSHRARRRGAADAARVVALKIEPAERALQMSAGQQLLATAVYSDGQTRDVTHAAAYSSNADLVADVDDRGLLNVGNRPGGSRHHD